MYPLQFSSPLMSVARNAEEQEEEGDDDGPQARAQHEGDVIEETIFTFESFELVSSLAQRASRTVTYETLSPHPQKFANSDITQSLLTYLARYKEFTSPDEMKRIVSLLHRQAVRAKAEGLFFQVKSCLTLVEASTDLIIICFRPDIRTEPVQNSPRGSKVIPQGPAVQRSRSAHQLHTPSILQSRRGGLIRTYRGNAYLLPSPFSAGPTSGFSFVAQALFPKNRNRWKQYSSWAPEPKSNNKGKDADPRFPPDVQVKKGYSWSEELAIAMAALQEAGQGELIEWVKEVSPSRSRT
jgi:replication fork protection complex subunit Tof1/Swi1